MKRDGRERYDRLDMSVSQSITRNEEDLRKKAKERGLRKKYLQKNEKEKRKNARKKKEKIIVNSMD